MKRTFTVTIEDDPASRLNKTAALVKLCELWGGVLTETTATHAKEREVIAAALEQAFTNGRTIAGYNEWVNATEVTDEKARELRVLMEGKG